MGNPEVIVFFILLLTVVIYSWWNSTPKKSKFISRFVIPLILLLGWGGQVLYQAYKIENVPSVLTDEFKRNDLVSYKEGELLKGEKIVGKFKASENNLGIIGLRFWNFYRLNDDFIIFRIRQFNQLDWYYEHSYKSDQFQPNQYFTVGFPPIEDSRDKTYIFEFESSHGVPGNAIGMSEVNPTFIAKYKYPKTQIMASVKDMVTFSWVKLLNLVKKSEFTAATYIYLLPLVLHLITLWDQFVLARNKVKSYFNIFLTTYPGPISVTIITIGVILDIFFVIKGNLTMSILIILWFTMLKKYSLPSKLFFYQGMILLVVSSLFYYQNHELWSERTSSWALIFFVFTVITNLTLIKSKKLIA